MAKGFNLIKEENLSEPITSWNFPILVKESLSGDKDFSKKLRDYCKDKDKKIGDTVYLAFLRGLRRYNINLQEKVRENSFYDEIKNLINIELKRNGVKNKSELIKKEMEEQWKKEKYF